MKSRDEEEFEDDVDEVMDEEDEQEQEEEEEEEEEDEMVDEGMEDEEEEEEEENEAESEEEDFNAKAKKRTKAKKRSRDEDDEDGGRRTSVTAARKRKVVSKKDPPLKQLETAMKAHKWWEDEPMTGNQKWKTLEHNGVMFPEPYRPHGIKLLYDGREVDLTPEQEEVATLYAEVPLDGPQLGDPKIAQTFNKNFFEDFKEVLGKSHFIKNFQKLDFSRIREHVQKLREEKKNLSKEEKEIKKQQTEDQRMIFSFALVDGHLQKVGNVMVEPPGLFRGRGFHPLTGKLKKRVMPEQITINIGEDSPVPPCPVPGHAWGAIVHKKDVSWLAFWKENVLNGTKYVWLAASSMFKGQADMEKYEKARRLKGKIKLIRNDYEKKLGNREPTIRQLGTAMWVIDRLALRVGNEKDEDEADTVGCCSLRVEHVSIDKATQSLTLDFLGKDSMRHFQTYPVVEQYGTIGAKVLKNFETFIKNKKPSEEVFDKLEVGELNGHLKTLMPGLSAKVFRTMNASVTLQEQLPRRIDIYAPDQEKVLTYNDANREVAILCNHQRTVSKAAENNIEKLSVNIEMFKMQLEELRSMFKRRNKNKDINLKPELSPNATMEEKKRVAHLFTKQPRADEVQRRIESWEKKIKTAKLNFQIKDDNKSVALGTSKINYIDPRITVAWCKRNELPIEKVFAAALRDKFPWSMSVSEDFVW